MRRFAALLRKELRVEMRSKQTLNGILLFSLLAAVLSAAAVGPAPSPSVTAGLLWLALLFVGMLGLSRAFAREQEQGTLEGLRLAPVPAATVWLAKATYNTLLMLLVGAVTLPLLLLLTGAPERADLPLTALLLAVSLAGLACVATTISAITLHARARELLLPVVLFPLVFPLLNGSVSGLKKSLSGWPAAEVVPELVLVAAYLVVMLTLSLLTAGYVLEE